MGSGRSSAAARSRPQCRAGDFARRLGFAAWQGSRDDASIVPYGCGAGFWHVLQDISAANRQCTPQSAVADSSPCRGAFPKGSHPQNLPCKGRYRRRRRRGAAPGPTNTTNILSTPFSCVGADDLIGPPAGLMGSGRSSAAARSRPQCRAGDFARRLGFAAWQGLRDDASIVPYGCKARYCQTLRGIPAVNRQCPPQAAPCGASTVRFAVPASCGAR